MIIIEKTIIHNVIPFKESTIEWNKYDKVLITGINKLPGMSRNAVGKSMIVDMLVWSLWGKSTRELDKQSLRTEDRKPLYVKTFFSRDGVRYCVTRTMSSKGVVGIDLKRFYNEKIDRNFQTGKTNKITQDMIDKILDIDFISFISTSYYSQDSVNTFLNGTPKERENVITSFFSLWKWDSYKKIARDRFNENLADRNAISEKLSVYSDLVKGIDEDDVRVRKNKAYTEYTQAKEEIESLEKDYGIIREYERIKSSLFENEFVLKNAKSMFNQSMQMITDDIKKAEETIAQEDVEHTIKNIKTKIRRKSILEENYKTSSDTYEGLQTERDERLKKLHYYEASAKTCLLNAKEWGEIIKLSGDEKSCPTCGQIIHPEYEKFIINKITKNNGHLDDWKRRIVSSRKGIRKIEDSIEVIVNKRQNIQSKLNRIQAMEGELYELEEKKKLIKVKKEQIQKVTKKYNDKRKIYTALIREQKKELSSMKDKILSDTLDSYAIKNFITIQYKLLNTTDKEYRKCKNILSQYRSYKRKMAGIEKKQEGIEHNIEMYEYLVKAYIMIKLYVIDIINQSLQNQINITLSSMEIQTKVKLDIEYDKKDNSGKITKYGITLSSPDEKERNWKSFSGGEKKRITLAVYFSFQKIAEKFSKQIVNLLIFDEVFGGLDVAGRDMMMKLLDGYKNKNLFVITHLEDVMSLFKRKLTIIRHSNGVSTIEK